MNKQALRDNIKQQKKHFPLETRKVLSKQILERLAHHPRFIRAQTILLYHSLPDEVDTHEFIRYWSRYKTILLPVVVGSQLELRVYQTSSQLLPGSYGIMEPQSLPFLNYPNIELAVIPGMAFDREGNRLGRGKGYYDRLLSSLKAHKIYKIGICFEFQYVQEIPTEAHDIPMDEVIY